MIRMIDILRAMVEDREGSSAHVGTVRYMIRTAPTPSHGGEGILYRRMGEAPALVRALRLADESGRRLPHGGEVTTGK